MDDLGYPHDLGNTHMIGGNVEPTTPAPPCRCSQP